MYVPCCVAGDTFEYNQDNSRIDVTLVTKGVVTYV